MKKIFGGLGVDDRCAMEPNFGVVQNLGVAISMGTVITLTIGFWCKLQPTAMETSPFL